MEEILKDFIKLIPTECSDSLPSDNPCLLFKMKSIQNSILLQERSPRIILSIQAVLDVLWEELNTGHWSQIPESKRKCYALISLFKVVRLVQETIFGGCVQHKLKEAIKAADMGLLMGCGYQEQLSEAAKVLNSLLSKEQADDQGSYKNYSHLVPYEKDCETDWKFKGITGKLVSTEKCPSLEYFYQNYFNAQVPVKLQDCISHWPALEKWRNIDYLVNLAGPRMVPIELGSSYTEDSWGQKLIPFQDFVNNYITQKANSVGYLAQHQLFDQIPELRNDIYVPEYCCFSDLNSEDDEGSSVEINAWFGPSETVSPLHFDPKHNFLTQVIGRKRILLYPPTESENLYPHETSMLHNTSQVDPYNPDYKCYPKYQGSVAYECHLYPGEMLYIPPKWWHHVRSLDTSFSVSFWWQ